MMSILGGLAYASAYGIAAIPLAALADRGGARKVLSFCLLIWSAATFACGLARQFTQLLVMRSAVGLGEAGGIPASLSLISGTFSRRQRPLAVGIFYSANGLSLCLGVPVISMIVAAWGWRSGFTVFGALGILFVPVLFFFTRDAKVGKGETLGDARQPALPALGAMLKVRPFLFILLSHFLVFTGIAANTTFTVAYLIRYYHFSYAGVAALNGVPMGVAGVLGGLAGGALVARLVKRTGNVDWMNWVSALSALAGAISLAIAFAGISVAVTAAGCILGYFFIMARYATGYSGALEYVPAGAKGTAAAVLVIIQSVLAGSLGPLLVGLVSDHFKPGYGDRIGLQFGLLIVVPLTMAAGALIGIQPLRGHLPDERVLAKA
jgi:predicted MFS family arabinose efflux permease